MVELNLSDPQGGIKRTFEPQRGRSFPMSDYDLSKSNQVSVSSPARILDERYTQLLMEQRSFTLTQAIDEAHTSSCGQAREHDVEPADPNDVPS